MAWGVSRMWGCACGLEDFASPFHLAVEHMAWVLSCRWYTTDSPTPLFPTVEGLHAQKTTLVDTFEALGAILCQPTNTVGGLRIFGVHTPRVTGAQAFASIGIEINKIRIMHTLSEIRGGSTSANPDG